MHQELDDIEILEYCSIVPLALALERLTEVNLMRSQSLIEPILDVGCGDGLFAKFVFERGADVIGIDPLHHELVFTSEDRSPRIVVGGLGNALPFGDETFGTAMSNSVLEHIPAVEQVLREVNRVLKPNGCFLITVPSLNFEKYSVCAQVLTFLRLRGLSMRFQRTYNRFWNHFHAYSKEEWATLFEKCDFTVQKIVEYNGRASCAINDALAPFGIFGKIRRRFGRKWVISPAARNAFLCLLRPLILRHVQLSRSGDALYFFALEKKS